MKRFALCMTALFAAAPGGACTWLAPFDMSRIGGADLVLVGRVTGYLTLNEAPGAALVTLDVDEALKGDLTGEVLLVWNSGMAQGPHAARAQGRVLVGVMAAGRAADPMAVDARPDLPAIVQPGCSEVWMMPALDQTVKAARKALQ